MFILRFLSKNLCLLILPDKQFCTTWYDGILELWYKQLMKIINPVRVCHQHGLCSSRIIPDSNKEYRNRLLIDRPPKNSFSYATENTSKTYKFGVFNDIHIDRRYKEVIRI